MTMATTETFPVPPFRLMLPAGWEEVPADEAAVRALAERSSDVFRSAHRPDLDAQFRNRRRNQRGRATESNACP